MKSWYSNKKILITGGAGFIGSHLAEKLVEFGAHVTILDNLSTGTRNNLKTIEQNIYFLQGDIRNKTTCLAAVKNIEIIFHLAAHVSVPESCDNPTECYSHNIVGTLNLLEAAYYHNVNHVVFASSAAIYGRQSLPCHENMIAKPESPYGHSKLIGELLCKQKAQSSDMHISLLRFFNVYGPRQSLDGSYISAIASFKKNMQNNKPIIIYGDGTQIRDFIHVKNVIKIATQVPCVQTDKELTLNVAQGKPRTLLEMIELLKTDYPNFTAGYVCKPARPGDIHVSQADCNKLFSYLKPMHV